MNKPDRHDQDNYRTFLLMEEIDKEEPVSQRELANRLGIALGLVNSYLKNMVSKGYVRVRSFPRNRYAYLLTPKGLTEKSRLALQHLNYFTSLYTTTRKDYLKLFQSLKAQGVEAVSFCGWDEVAEIAYLSLAEMDMALVHVLDDENVGEMFFGRPILAIGTGSRNIAEPVVVTSLKRGVILRNHLIDHGIDPGSIYLIDAISKG